VPSTGDNPNLHQPGLRTQAQHLGEQVADRGLVTDPKPGDRRVIQWLVRGDHPERHILAAAPLNPSRRTHPDRVRVHQQRHHHPRIVRRPAMPVSPIRRIELLEFELIDGLRHEIRQMIRRQPIPQTRRQQQLLITITQQKVLGHP
jgi:hypothetical protein